LGISNDKKMFGMGFEVLLAKFKQKYKQKILVPLGMTSWFWSRKGEHYE